MKLSRRWREAYLASDKNGFTKCAHEPFYPADNRNTGHLTLFLPPQLESPFIMLFILFLYLVIPALIAFVVTHRTQQSAIGYRVGMFSGVSCSVLLFLVMVIIIIFQIANAEATTTAIGRLGAGAFLQTAFIVGFVLAFFLNGMGALLAMLGAFLGSRRGRSQA